MPIDPTQPALEPHTQQFVDGLAGALPIYTLSPVDARTVLERVQSAPVGKPSAQIEDIAFPVGPTGSVPLRIVRPVGTTEVLPVVLYFHGGGWILGGRDTHDRLVREIAVGAAAAVVFVDYARAPEARYPVAIEQAYAATRYVVDQSASLRIDPLRLAVAGDSVGGNMAAAVTLMARQRRGPHAISDYGSAQRWEDMAAARKSRTRLHSILLCGTAARGMRCIRGGDDRRPAR